MAVRQQGRIVAIRQAEPVPSLLALSAVSTGLAILVLGGVWLVFFGG
jgi:hypothetical protein